MSKIAFNSFIVDQIYLTFDRYSPLDPKTCAKFQLDWD